MFQIISSIEDESDRAYVENLYLTYGKKLYIFAFDILKSREDAEDCLQDLIKKIIDNLELFKSVQDENLIRLLVKCMRNIAIDKERKEIIEQKEKELRQNIALLEEQINRLSAIRLKIADETAVLEV